MATEEKRLPIIEVFGLATIVDAMRILGVDRYTFLKYVNKYNLITPCCGEYPNYFYDAKDIELLRKNIIAAGGNPLKAKKVCERPYSTVIDYCQLYTVTEMAEIAGAKPKTFGEFVRKLKGKYVPYISGTAMLFAEQDVNDILDEYSDIRKKHPSEHQLINPTGFDMRLALTFLTSTPTGAMSNDDYKMA